MDINYNLRVPVPVVNQKETEALDTLTDRYNKLIEPGVMAGMDGGRMIPEFSRCRICPWHYFGIKSLWVAIFVTSRK